MNTNSKFWEAAFQQAWLSYCSGSVPIGAVITTDNGEIVSVGRNAIYETEPTLNSVYHHQLAHAELNALLKISKHKYPNINEFSIYTTLEPCPMCFGAFVMSRIKKLHFAATDLIAGSVSNPLYNNYIKTKNLSTYGPYTGYEFLQIALLTVFILNKRPSEAGLLFPIWEKVNSEAVELGINWYNKKYLENLKNSNLRQEQVLVELLNYI